MIEYTMNISYITGFNEEFICIAADGKQAIGKALSYVADEEVDDVRSITIDEIRTEYPNKPRGNHS